MSRNTPKSQKHPVVISSSWKNRGRSWLRAALGTLCLAALCVTVRYYWWNASSASAEEAEEAPVPSNFAPARSSQVLPPPAARGARREVAPSAPENKQDTSAIVATVNTQRITRKILAEECRRLFGAEVIESMVNKHLIVAECKHRGITVSGDEVDAEIERMAKRFSIPVDQWMKLLKQERNVSPEQYRNDIIWPTLALRKLAGERLVIGRDELLREYEVQYGEAVRARLIAVSSRDKAEKLQAQASAEPKEFGNLAKNYSEDAPSASAKGMINPIRKHGSFKEIEQAVFRMADGEVSPVIHVGGQYVILKREGVLPAKEVTFEQAVPRLEEIIRDRKMRSVAQDVFQQLQKDAKVENVWNDPVKHKRMPGVAAMINGDPITVEDLDEECIARHGQQVLEGLISRRILEQACKRKSVEIGEDDLDTELARAAVAGGKIKADGSADVQAWLDLVTKKRGVTAENYRHDALWPAAALRKLVEGKVQVSEEDIQKGYEANFGTQVRCLAIVLNNARRAQQVFDLARKSNSTEAFGELASQYSIEPSSQANHGEVPPIRRYGGQPQLEEEAFQLKPGEISGVIQVGDKFVILRCEGYEKKAKVEFARVRDEIYEDLRDKKLHLAMTQCFEELQEAAAIDNYLAGTSHSPNQKQAAAREAKASRMPSLRQAPGK